MPRSIGSLKAAVCTLATHTVVPRLFADEPTTLLCATKGSSFLTIGLFWRGFLATCTTTVVLHFLAFLKVTAQTTCQSVTLTVLATSLQSQLDLVMQESKVN